MAIDLKLVDMLLAGYKKPQQVSLTIPENGGSPALVLTEKESCQSSLTASAGREQPQGALNDIQLRLSPHLFSVKFLHGGQLVKGGADSIVWKSGSFIASPQLPIPTSALGENPSNDKQK